MTADTSKPQSSTAQAPGRKPLSVRGRTLLLLVAGIGFLTVVLSWQKIHCWYAANRLTELLGQVRIEEAVVVAGSYETSAQCPKVRLLSVQAYRQSGDLRAAETLLADSESLIRNPERMAKERALIDARRGRLVAAETAVSRLLRDPDLDGRDVCEAFAIGFRLNRRLEEAALLLDAWKNDWPQDHRPFYHEGLMYQTLTNWTDAVTAYQKAIDLNDDSLVSRVRLGECLNQLERGAEAEQQFRFVVDREPENLEAWQGLAVASQQQGDNISARSAFLSVLQRNPASFSARLAIAEIDFDFDNKDTDKAEAAVTALLDVWPDDARSLYLQSRIAVADGRQNDAERILNQWKLADTEIQRLEADIQKLASDYGNIDLQVAIGAGMLRYYSRDMGQQYLAAALQMQPGHKEATVALADFESRSKRLEALPLPAATTSANSVNTMR